MSLPMTPPPPPRKKLLSKSPALLGLTNAFGYDSTGPQDDPVSEI